MNYSQIKSALVSAGLPSYAVSESHYGDTVNAFVHFEDLPKNKKLDKIIRSMEFKVADKGLIFICK